MTREDEFIALLSGLVDSVDSLNGTLQNIGGKLVDAIDDLNSCTHLGLDDIQREISCLPRD